MSNASVASSNSNEAAGAGAADISIDGNSEEAVEFTPEGLQYVSSLITRALCRSAAFEYDSEIARRYHRLLSEPSQWLTGLSAMAGVVTFISMLITTLSSELQLTLYAIFGFLSAIVFFMKRQDNINKYGTKSTVFCGMAKTFAVFANRHQLYCFSRRDLPTNFDLYLERVTEEFASLERQCPKLLTQHSAQILRGEIALPRNMQQQLELIRQAVLRRGHQPALPPAPLPQPEHIVVAVTDDQPVKWWQFWRR